VRVPLPVTILAALALAACAGTATPTSGPPTTAASPAATAPASAAQSAAAITCGATGTGTAATIANFAFSPNPVGVASSGFVTWTNNDTTTHTVTFDNGPDCGRVAVGANVTAQFSAPGTYAYHCSIHTSMKGSVTVTG
jgi:plastocyanin